MSKSQALVAIDPAKLVPEAIPELRKNFLVLTPSDQVAQMNPFFAIRLSHVAVDMEVEHFGRDGVKVTSNHVWKVPGGGQNYAPTKVLLNKISAAAGIEWVIEETKKVDDGRDRMISRYRAVGQIRLPSGEIKKFVDEATEDGYIVEEEILEKHLAKVGSEVDVWKNGAKAGKRKLEEAECRENARKEFRQYLKFINERCLSRAMNRAIRQVLALNGTYTVEDLRKGFIVPQVNFSPDWNDPRVAALAKDALGGKFSSMFQSEQLPAGEETKMLAAGPTADPLTGEVTGHPEEEAPVVASLDSPLEAQELQELGDVVEAVLVEDLATPFSGSVLVEPDIDAPPVTAAQIKKLAMHRERLWGKTDADKERAMKFISELLGREVVSLKALTEAEAASMIPRFEKTPPGRFFPKDDEHAAE